MNFARRMKMYPKKLFTLIFVKQDSEILLGLKKRGLGVGKWNGFGGKVEPNETILEGAKRELKEESNLDVTDLKHIGIVSYEVENRSHLDVVHIFTADKFSGEILESEEMKPQWYEIENIPYSEMWPDAEIWYKYVLNDIYFTTYIKYDEDVLKVKNLYIEQFDTLNRFLDSIK